ncbi:ATP-binding protein [Hymenobacter artigasi]|uniref:ATP-dependent DNA helicase RecG n=1 Tax=Hymenobacter artigasi TaxID=2719616 RepID=A0ABX1HBX4_9BACT|nr:ATP-binding protein [Hymenobacter artigasi]NKI87733.1 ATP-dependent DNA helicase RecG [Hymenobacter artigasi]
MDIAALIQQLNTTDENSRLEAKQGSGIDKSFMESVCAFANEPNLGGGIILLGLVRDENNLFPSYQPVGVPDPDKLGQEIATKCATMFNVPVRPQINSAVFRGKVVIGVSVPEASASEKPVFFPNLGLPRGAYRRIGPTDHHCTEDDMAVFFGERRAESFDKTVISGAVLEDIDADSVAAYRRAREKVNASAEELQWNDEELLASLSATVLVGGERFPTITGLLLFGTRQAIRRLLPMTRVDYIRVPGKEWVENPDERFSHVVDMRGPLLQLVQRVQDTIIDDLPRGFVLREGEVQAETPRLSTRVLREAIVNAVMHRSYKKHSPVQVIRYNNRLEIINPGYSLKAEEQLGEPGSENRNPHLAAVFHETNTAETKGSGIRTMRRLMQEAGFAPPTFESDRRGDRFVTRLLLQHFLSPSDLQWLSLFASYNLNEAQKNVLIYLRETGAVDNAGYRQLSGVDTLTASRDLRAMRTSGLLEMKGQGAATYYMPGASFINEQLPTEMHELSIQAGKLPIQGGQLPIQGRELPIQVQNLMLELGEELKAKVNRIGRRAKSTIIQEVILDLCRVRPYTAGELAILFHRSREALQATHLASMVVAGKLAYTKADNPTHPHQAYTATS